MANFNMDAENMDLENYTNNTLDNTTLIDTSTNSCNDLYYITYYAQSFGFVTNADPAHEVPLWEAALTMAFFIFVTIATIFGNVLVILSVLTYKPLRTVQNSFIVSLAAADLTVPILVLPFNIIYSITGRWEFGTYICKIWLTCDILCCTASILNLCAIALDRFLAVSDPFNYYRNNQSTRVILMTIMTWTISLFISCLPLLGWNDWPEEFTPDTPCRLSTQPGYAIFSSLGSFFIPMIVVVTVYRKTYLIVKHQEINKAKANESNIIPSKGGEACDTENITQTKPIKSASEVIQIRYHSQKDNNAKNKKKITNEDSVIEIAEGIDHNTSSDINSKLEETHECEIKVISSELITIPTPATDNQQVNKKSMTKKQRMSLNRERKLARTLGIITGVFIACWSPFFVLYLVISLCPKCCIPPKLKYFVTWLGYVNSAINPYIYTFSNRDFRIAFIRLLCRNQNPPVMRTKNKY